jgi:hypothetical protein
MINELPTVYEVVSGRKAAKEKTTPVNGTNNTKSSIKKVNFLGTLERKI